MRIIYIASFSEEDESNGLEENSTDDNEQNQTESPETDRRPFC